MRKRWNEEKRVSKDDLVLMISYLLGINLGQARTALAREHIVLEDNQEEELELMVQKRATGLPLQYAIGRWNFYGRDFLVDERALIPRPETEFLVEDVINRLVEDPEKEWEICDIGTGTGIIPLTLAYESVERRARGEVSLRLGKIVGGDISPEARTLAEENEQFLAERSPIGLKWNVEKQTPLSWVQSDLFENISGVFDVIISNPPYVEERKREDLEAELSYEPSLALFAGDDGLDVYRRLIPQAYNHLKPGGLLFLEIGDGQGQEISQILANNNFQEIDIYNDYAGFNRRVIARK